VTKVNNTVQLTTLIKKVLGSKIQIWQ